VNTQLSKAMPCVLPRPFKFPLLRSNTIEDGSDDCSVCRFRWACIGNSAETPIACKHWLTQTKLNQTQLPV
jgi:hypothetical protein